MPPQYKSFKVEYDGIARVLITPVHVFKGFDPTQITPHPTPKQYNAIWDTGATHSVITKKVIDECKLKPIGMVEVRHAGGAAKSNTYLINIGLPNGVGVPLLRVSQGDICGADLLLGMDIISKGDLSITQINGKTNFAFRMPMDKIINVKDIKKQSVPISATPAPKVGRNDPCPCGSGKKYKKCCG